MKKIFLLFVISSLFISCVSEGENCGCTPPPGHDENLIVNLKNENGDNLLNPDTFGYISDEKFAFYLLTSFGTINLTKEQRNETIINEYISEKDGVLMRYINLRFSWYLKDNNGIKEGSYVIDYSGLYPNDTIYTKYSVTTWEESDQLLEVKLNGELTHLDSVSEKTKSITIIK